MISWSVVYKSTIKLVLDFNASYRPFDSTNIIFSSRKWITWVIFVDFYVKKLMYNGQFSTSPFASGGYKTWTPGPWTGSTDVVHGPGVHVLYLPVCLVCWTVLTQDLDFSDSDHIKTKFCRLYYKQVISWFLVKLRINFTCVFKVFWNCPRSLRDLGNFGKLWLKHAWN